MENELKAGDCVKLKSISSANLILVIEVIKGDVATCVYMLSGEVKHADININALKKEK